MDMIKETEIIANGERIIKYFYKCPACGVKLSHSHLTIKQDGTGVTITVARPVPAH